MSLVDVSLTPDCVTVSYFFTIILAFVFIILITFKGPLCERCLVNNLELLSSKYCTTQHLLSKIMMAFREKKTAGGSNNPFV